MRLREGIHWLKLASRGSRRLILGCSAAGVLQVLSSLLFIYFSKALVDLATGHEGGSFVVYAFLMVLCMGGQLLFSSILARGESLGEAKVLNALRYDFFGLVMESRWMGREQMHTGDVLNRIEDDSATIARFLCEVVPSVIVTSFRLLSAFAFLAFLDWRLSLSLVFIMPVALAISKGYMRRMRSLTREIRSTDSRVQSHLQENLQHRTLISAMERTDDASSELSSLQSSLFSLVRERTDFSLFSKVVVQVGFALGYLAAFLWGVFGLWKGAATFGMVTAFLQLVSQVQRPVVDLGNQIPSFIKAFISAERLRELEQLPLEERGEPIRLSAGVGIRFDRVSFAYPDGGGSVLKDFSYDFRPGSMTAVVGETGAGKSTLIRLILALVLPKKGSIVLYDGSTEASASPLTRCNIVYVPQGNTLLRGTIRENLLLGNPQASDEQLREALRLSMAEFVYDLPEGLETSCGELGAGLSEGQAQRLAIARGLLRDGGILLLDEPTSSLDTETEKALLENLSQLAQGRTLILVTHREAAAAMCSGLVRVGATW